MGQLRKKMLDKEELIEIIDYLQKGPKMIQWLKNNWWKVLIGWLTFDSFLRWFGLYKDLSSFMNYVEMVLGGM